jgi:hypothetical protein
MHYSGSQSGVASSWGDTVRAAAETGGAALDAEQAKAEHDLYGNIPDFIKGPLMKLMGVESAKPSQTFNYTEMVKSSGPSKLESEEWGD